MAQEDREKSEARRQQILGGDPRRIIGGGAGGEDHEDTNPDDLSRPHTVGARTSRRRRYVLQGYRSEDEDQIPSDMPAGFARPDRQHTPRAHRLDKRNPSALEKNNKAHRSDNGDSSASEEDEGEDRWTQPEEDEAEAPSRSLAQPKQRGQKRRRRDPHPGLKEEKGGPSADYDYRKIRKLCVTGVVPPREVIQRYRKHRQAELPPLLISYHNQAVEQERASENPGYKSLVLYHPGIFGGIPPPDNPRHSKSPKTKQARARESRIPSAEKPEEQDLLAKEPEEHVLRNSPEGRQGGQEAAEQGEQGVAEQGEQGAAQQGGQ